MRIAIILLITLILVACSSEIETIDEVDLTPKIERGPFELPQANKEVCSRIRNARQAKREAENYDGPDDYFVDRVWHLEDDLYLADISYFPDCPDGYLDCFRVTASEIVYQWGVASKQYSAPENPQIVMLENPDGKPVRCLSVWTQTRRGALSYLLYQIGGDSPVTLIDASIGRLEHNELPTVVPFKVDHNNSDDIILVNIDGEDLAAFVWNGYGTKLVEKS